MDRTPTAHTCCYLQQWLTSEETEPHEQVATPAALECLADVSHGHLRATQAIKQGGAHEVNAKEATNAARTDLCQHAQEEPRLDGLEGHGEQNFMQHGREQKGAKGRHTAAHLRMRRGTSAVNDTAVGEEAEPALLTSTPHLGIVHALNVHVAQAPLMHWNVPQPPEHFNRGCIPPVCVAGAPKCHLA